MTTSTGPGRGIKKLITDDGASLQLCSAAVSAVPPADCSNARLYEGWSGSGCYCGGAAPRDSRLHDGIAPLLAPRWDTSKGRKYPRTSATYSYSWDVTLNTVSLSRAVIVVTSSLQLLAAPPQTLNVEHIEHTFNPPLKHIFKYIYTH